MGTGWWWVCVWERVCVCVKSLHQVTMAKSAVDKMHIATIPMLQY